MIIDILLGLVLVAAVLRGREIGMVRQVLSLAGFALGIFIGAWIQPHVIGLAQTPISRTLLSFVIIIACAMFLMTAGEFLGVYLKRKLQKMLSANKLDALLGSGVGAVSFLVGVWLIYPLAASLPDNSLQQALKQSAIVGKLNTTLPAAPQILSSIGRLINPNGFPDVFAGLDREPTNTDAPLPNLGELQSAVELTRSATVKLEGKGCGGLVDGSGFIAAPNTVITNAHVVAGVSRPTVIDGNGRHNAHAIWFDPNLDVAILHVEDLTGNALPISTANAPKGTPAVVLGYPGGGSFSAKPATILDQFSATGLNIYGEGSTNRSVYELKAEIIPGNSGGPLVSKEGRVIGLIFAESTSHDAVGYALTMRAVSDSLDKALAQDRGVSTGQCAAE